MRHFWQSNILKVHRRFVASVKDALQATYGNIPDPAKVVPTIVGAEPLHFSMPPMMEQAFGYGGSLRFIEFSYSPRTRQIGYSDGGDHVVCDEHLWMTFVNHPLIAGELTASRYPTLYGNPARGKQGCSHRRAYGIGAWHCLLFDRQQRRPYLCTRDQMMLFFVLTEPDDGDNHTLLADGLLLSPGCESYKMAPAPEFAERLRAWLDTESIAGASVHSPFLNHRDHRKVSGM